MERRVDAANAVGTKRQNESHDDQRGHRHRSGPCVGSTSKPESKRGQQYDRKAGKQLALRSAARWLAARWLAVIAKQIGTTVDHVAGRHLEIAARIRGTPGGLVQRSSESFRLLHSQVHDRERQ